MGLSGVERAGTDEHEPRIFIRMTDMLGQGSRVALLPVLELYIEPSSLWLILRKPYALELQPQSVWRFSYQPALRRNRGAVGSGAGG